MPATAHANNERLLICQVIGIEQLTENCHLTGQGRESGHSGFLNVNIGRREHKYPVFSDEEPRSLL